MHVTHEISRRVSEGVVIGEGIVVTVLDVRGEQVCLEILHPDGTTEYCEISPTRELAELELSV